jgi:hypothetical protein
MCGWGVLSVILILGLFRRQLDWFALVKRYFLRINVMRTQIFRFRISQNLCVCVCLCANETERRDCIRGVFYDDG